MMEDLFELWQFFSFRKADFSGNLKKQTYLN